MTNKILFVDDDGSLLAGIQRAFRRQFEIETASDGAMALERISRGDRYAVVVADMQMPGMTGVEFLKRIQSLAPDTVRLMMTGNTGQKAAIDAVNDCQVYRFLTKPCPPAVLVPALEAALGHYRLITTERDLLERTLNGSTKMLLDILSVVDPASFGKAQRLLELMRHFIASQKSGRNWELELAAMLSPIGYVALPRPVPTSTPNDESLTATENTALARALEIGANLISNIPRLENVAQIVRYQAKNFDGSGLPSDTVAGDNIPLGARILRVLNDLVLFESKGIPWQQAFESMEQLRGRYDPTVVRAVAAQLDFLVQEKATGSAKQVTLLELREGQRLLSDIETLDGVLVVRAVTVLSGIMLGRIRTVAEVSGIREPIQIAA